MSNTQKFGIIGTGVIAGYHAKAIAETPGAELAACMDRSPERAAAFAVEHAVEGYHDMEAFLAHPGLTAVAICTPSGLHLEPALEAIEAGMHAVVEKPLEITTERCDRMIEAARRKGVLLSGVFNSRFHPGSRLIRKALEEGRFGRLVMGDAYVKWFRSQEYYDSGQWRGTWKLDGGGALMNQSIHAVDLLQWFMGPVASVSAQAGTLGHRDIEVEDTAAAVLRFAGGAMGVIEGSTAIYPGRAKRIEVCGTAGSVVLEEEALTEWSFADSREEDRRIREEFAPREDGQGGASDPTGIDHRGHLGHYLDFMEALETGREPLVNGEEARKAVEIIQGIYESVRTGRTVTIGGADSSTGE